MKPDFEHPPQTFTRREIILLLITGSLAASVTGGSIVAIVEALRQEQTKKKEEPQGFWEEEPTLEGTRLRAKINASMNVPYLGVDQVVVSIRNPQGHSQTVATLVPADAMTNTYILDVDIADYLVDAEGQPLTTPFAVEVAFNVWGSNGKVSYSPSGGRSVQYLPTDN